MSKSREDYLCHLEMMAENPKAIHSTPAIKKMIGEMRAMYDELQAANSAPRRIGEFDFDNPKYCEIIERIHGSVHGLLDAAGYDAETELDVDDGPIEHMICQCIDKVAADLRSSAENKEA